MTKQFVKDLTPGMRVDIALALIESIVRQDKNGNDYLTLTLADNSGKLMGVRFSPTPHEVEGITRWKFVRIVGSVDQYNGALQLKVDRSIEDIGTPANLGDFMLASPVPLETMRAKLDAHVRSVREPNLRALLHAIFESDPKLRQKFEDAPAAKGNHHAFLHGLLQHTLEVTDLTAAVVDVQNSWGGKRISRCLAVTGALLHDIGKIYELTWSSPSFDYTARGSLLGHITIGSQFVSKLIYKHIPDFPSNLHDALLHIMLSHHGKGEFGSPVVPMFPEAQVVSSADLLDVQLFYMDEAMGKSDKLIEFQNKLDGTPKYSGRAVFGGSLGLTAPSPLGEAEEMPPLLQRPALPRLRFALPSGASATPTLSFETRRLPVLGSIAAGQPSFADEQVEEFYDVEDPGIGGDSEAFLLRIKGDSMTGDGIQPHDLIVVRRQEQAEPGDIVVALIDDEATVKRFHKEPNGDITLLPSNPTHQPIPIPDPDALAIRGKVVGVLVPPSA